MKILMASHYFASHKGGVEIVAEALYTAFSKKGIEVVWMAGGASPQPEQVQKSRSVSLPIFNFVEDRIGLPFPIPTVGAITTIFGEVWKSNVLILHDCLYLSNILAFFIAKSCGIPTIIIQHTRYFPNGTRMVNAIMKLATAIVTKPMLSSADQVVFIGETTMKSYDALRYRALPELIFNGVNTDLFRKLRGPESATGIRCKFALPQDQTVILFVGRFIEKKGLPVIRRMAEMRPDWIWALAGWGPLDPRAWKAANVRVFSGLDDASIAELYRCCNLLVLPSTGEGGVPLVAREALASGLTVVCGEETLEADSTMGQFVVGAPVYLEDDDATARAFLIALDNALLSEVEANEEFETLKSYAISQNSWHRAVERYLDIISCLVPKSIASAATSETCDECESQ
jgi:glycosyltransferase involved in cell wall biosynthesis